MQSSRDLTPRKAAGRARGPQRLGDILGAVLGPILRRRRPQADPQQALFDRLTDDELLDVIGPSWAAMTPDQRERYPDRWATTDWQEVAARERQARTAEPADPVPALVDLD